MSLTGLDVFDTTLHKTNGWLSELMEGLGCSRHDAYVGLRATLHALRDRLPVAEVAHLGAQLPMVVRGFYYEGWNPTGKPVRERTCSRSRARWTRWRAWRASGSSATSRPRRPARADASGARLREPHFPFRSDIHAPTSCSEDSAWKPTRLLIP